MLLTPHETERLMISYAAELAWRRRGRGLRLNHPEAVAVLCSFVLEAARDGRGVAELMQAGREVLTADDVLPGVERLLPEVQIEATFPDGTKLVTIHEPIGAGTASAGATGVARPGSVPAGSTAPDPVRPGEVLPAEGTITLSPGRPRTRLRVVNTGDRPIQVGSHYHFAQANPALDFDRAAAHGLHPDIPAGTAVRFEPGIERDVDLVPLAGTRVVAGLTLPAPGRLDAGPLAQQPAAPETTDPDGA
jgi:urease subunit gamma/beta